MKKHFPVTQAMREEVVDKLTIQAVAHHAVAIAGYLEALNTQFWTAHCSKVEALPGLEKQHWASLIQAGSVTAASNCYPTYKDQRGDDRSPVTKYFVAVAFRYKQDHHSTFVARLLTSQAFEGVKRFLDSRHDRDWKIRLVCPNGAVPRLHGMEDITDLKLKGLALLICSELESVVEAGLAFRSQAMDVLLACRTSRQVEDLFPEAAKLLPQPVKQDKALAPTELAANVRSMLSKGVPPVVQA
ncbi:hypothetical protein L4O36_000181 [Pseudomonas aeruginosa]|uniref:Uncharacterized protein n=2 Tax=Pseudomonas aeruginosa TaxID=287 RepID=A0A643ECK5_PSEAI|nr:hypothetical protein [Pseudomonas aeruginosa]EIU2540622.1 hypothetical protein [Pseudomonas aeruginosa]EKX7106283.1 hypothetical protein [Pseudomonas aeruginosa]ELK4907711.1 hypothetical protein [Pseudomonas aeruginosa]KAB0555904.1 hypothetical protein F7R07_28660 [Pseudomonas aeruginosa]KQJ64873.1 hypothetical protein AN399_14495 [Pseudomonas aeruginosa]